MKHRIGKVKNKVVVEGGGTNTLKNNEVLVEGNAIKIKENNQIKDLGSSSSKQSNRFFKMNMTENNQSFFEGSRLNEILSMFRSVLREDNKRIVYLDPISVYSSVLSLDTEFTSFYFSSHIFGIRVNSIDDIINTINSLGKDIYIDDKFIEISYEEALNLSPNIEDSLNNGL